MKNILTAFILYTITTLLLIAYMTSANACQLSIPESYIPTFLNPPISGHYEKCEDKQDEKCECVYNVDPYISEYVTETSNDPETGITIEQKVFKVSEAKKAANEAKKQAEKELELSNKAAKKALKQSIKNDIKEATTVAKLRALVEKLIEAQE